MSLSDRERYELELAHQVAPQLDAAHRAEIHADVQARWPITVAFIDQAYEERMAAA